MKHRSAAIAAAIVAVVIGLLIALLATSDTQQSSTANFEIVGKVAPPIEATTIDGEEFDLRSLRGKWVVVNFFASWCVGCRVEHPELVAFSESRPQDAQVVSVMFGDTEQAARDFFNELGGSWPAVVSNTGSIAIDFGVTAVPETLLVAPSGRVVQKWVSASGVTSETLNAAIASFQGDL